MLVATMARNLQTYLFNPSIAHQSLCSSEKYFWNGAMAHCPRRGRRGTRRIASSSAPAPPQPSVTWSSFVSAVGHLSHP